MMLAVVAGTVLGSTWIAGGDTKLTTAFLGIALVVYAAYTLFARQIRVPRRTEPWLSPLIGAITGAVAGNRRFRHPGSSLSPGAWSVEGRPRAGSRPLVYRVDDRARHRTWRAWGIPADRLAIGARSLASAGGHVGGAARSQPDQPARLSPRLPDLPAAARLRNGHAVSAMI